MEQPRQAADEQNAWKASKLLTSARGQRDKLIRETEPELIKLALKVAVDIIREEMDLKRDEISQIVRNALETVRQQRNIVVRVHPQDLENLEAAKPQLISRLGRAKDIDLCSDASIKPGGCVIDTEIGTIDAQPAHQLEQILEQLADSPLDERDHEDRPGAREELMYIHTLAAQSFRSTQSRSKVSEIPGMDITPNNLRRSKVEAVALRNTHFNEKIGDANLTRQTSPEGGETIQREVDARTTQICANAQKDVENPLEGGPPPSIEPQVFEAAALLAETRVLRDKLIRETEPQLIKLALKVAVKIVGHELEPDKNEIAQVVDKAIQKLRSKQYLTIRMNPMARQRVKTEKPKLQFLLQQDQGIELVEDQALGSDVCRIVTEVGIIDAQLETVFEPLLKTLLGKPAGPELAQASTE